MDQGIDPIDFDVDDELMRVEHTVELAPPFCCPTITGKPMTKSLKGRIIPSSV